MDLKKQDVEVLYQLHLLDNEATTKEIGDHLGRAEWDGNRVRHRLGRLEKMSLIERAGKDGNTIVWVVSLGGKREIRLGLFREYQLVEQREAEIQALEERTDKLKQIVVGLCEELDREPESYL